MKINCCLIVRPFKIQKKRKGKCHSSIFWRPLLHNYFSCHMHFTKSSKGALVFWLRYLPFLLGSTTFSVVGTWCNLFWSNCNTSERSGRFDGGGILSAVRSENKNKKVPSFQFCHFIPNNMSCSFCQEIFLVFPVSSGKLWKTVIFLCVIYITKSLLISRTHGVHRKTRCNVLNKTFYAQRK